jgi:apolipoprotein D and lipocalin family protein
MRRPKNLFFIIGAVAGVIFVARPGMAQSREPMKTVPHVEVGRYLGTWYQISRNVLPFEPANCACAQQTLGVAQSGNVSVYNSCNDGGPLGPLREIRGEAINDDPSTNARFTVDFGFPKKGQYWVIGLAADYRWAVVSDPSRYSLYVLSKKPTLNQVDYQAAIDEAAKQVDTSQLKLTSHVGCSYPSEVTP